jgi:hypothetical protein
MKIEAKNQTETNRIISMVLFRVFKEKAQESNPLKMRVPDGAIGRIIGLDPADTSHWKKGKKTVLNAVHLRRLIKQLGVDDAVVNDILDGNIPERFEREVNLWELRNKGKKTQIKQKEPA